MNTLRFNPELIQKYANQFNEIYLIIRLKYHIKIQNPKSRSFKYNPISFKKALNEYSRI